MMSLDTVLTGSLVRTLDFSRCTQGATELMLGRIPEAGAAGVDDKLSVGQHSTHSWPPPRFVRNAGQPMVLFDSEIDG